MTAEPEWNNFRTILALGRAGSAAGAARLLDVDASTVSRRLAAAEAAFGAVLVLPTPIN
jgi:DNA-binding transcriptional LysR family regulator